MKKTYLYVIIVSLLALVIFASGCINQNNNQTSQNNTTGSYAVNGLSFNYPIDWFLISQTNGNVHIINVIDQAYSDSNGTNGTAVEMNIVPKDENLTYANVKENFANATNNTTEGTVNIAGATANMSTFNVTDETGSQTHIKLIYFEKDNFVYILNFIVTGGANAQDKQQNFDTIINSLKTP